MPRFSFRCVSCGILGDLFGAAWPDFIREADGKSGVYIIRDRQTHSILYVGESHTGRLKKTLLRHFQAWSGKTAGATYLRGDVEIALEITAPGRAVARQNELICQLAPRDNVQGTDCEDSNPF